MADVQPSFPDMFRRIRAAAVMGLLWAVGWALAGVAIGALSLLTPFLPWELVFRVFDAPLPALAIPGFIGGTLFSLVLGVAGRQRSFDELSTGRVALWGVIGGVLLALVPALLVGVGLATLGVGSAGVLVLSLMLGVPFALLGAGSAATTLAIARKGESSHPERSEGSRHLPPA
jgi:drug/metabolite transporter (DMT)-like permease